MYGGGIYRILCFFYGVDWCKTLETPYKIFYGQLRCFSEVWHLEQSRSTTTTHVVSTSQNRKPAALIFFRETGGARPLLCFIKQRNMSYNVCQDTKKETKKINKITHWFLAID